MSPDSSHHDATTPSLRQLFAPPENPNRSPRISVQPVTFGVPAGAPDERISHDRDDVHFVWCPGTHTIALYTELPGTGLRQLMSHMLIIDGTPPDEAKSVWNLVDAWAETGALAQLDLRPASAQAMMHNAR